jgi:hypothetical protein
VSVAALGVRGADFFAADFFAADLFVVGAMILGPYEYHGNGVIFGIGFSYER